MECDPSRNLRASRFSVVWPHVNLNFTPHHSSTTKLAMCCELRLITSLTRSGWFGLIALFPVAFTICFARSFPTSSKPLLLFPSYNHYQISLNARHYNRRTILCVCECCTPWEVVFWVLANVDVTCPLISSTSCWVVPKSSKASHS